MKKVLLVSISCFALCAAATAFAADSKSGIAEGMYLGISSGMGGMDTPNETIPISNSFGRYAASSETKLRNGVTGRLFAGYLWGNEFKYGLETGGSLYPENKYTSDVNDAFLGHVSTKIKYTGYNLDLLGVARYNFANFNIFGKAGAAYTWQKAEGEVIAMGEKESEDKTKSKILPEVAIGIGYDFTPNIGVSTTYSHIFGKKLDNYKDVDKVASVNTLTLDLTYHFGNF